MTRSAFQALVLWDDSVRFESAAEYQLTHTVLTKLLHQEHALASLNANERCQLFHMLVTCMDAVGCAIQSESIGCNTREQLSHVLSDLLALSFELEKAMNINSSSKT